MMEHIDVITDAHVVKNGDATANGKAPSKKRVPAPLHPNNNSAGGNQDYFMPIGNEFKTLVRNDSETWTKTEIIPNNFKERPLKRQRSNRSTRSTTSSRRRQNEDGCVTCLRGTLHCYNVFILIIGCAALGIGIWLLVTDFGARKVTPIVNNKLYEVTTYLLIAGGGAVALLAFCGCCGTIREDKCVLSFYGSTLSLVLVVLGTACGLAFFFRGQFSDNIKVRMEKTLIESYGVDIRTNTENRQITEAWDAMQRQLKCCGAFGDVNSVTSWLLYSTAAKWNYRRPDRNSLTVRKVPDSCCAPGDLNLCIGETEFEGPPLHYAYGGKGTDKYENKNPYLYTDGCYDSLIEYLETYSAVVGGVAAVVPVFLIFGIIISFCLCARSKGYVHDEEVDL